MIKGSIMTGGQINGTQIENTSNLCKVKVDDVGFHIINNVGNGTSNIEKIRLTTYDYDGNGTIQFNNNNGQDAEISFSDSDLIIRSDNGISITGETTFNSSLKANTIKGNVIQADTGDIIISSGTGGKINLNTTNGRNVSIGGISSGIGFFGASPISKQTASYLPEAGTSTIHDLEVKINGILTKLELYGLFNVT